MTTIYDKIKDIKKEFNKKIEFKDINNLNLKYMGLSGVDEYGNIRKLFYPPTDPTEISKDIGTYIWNIDPNVIEHLKKYESKEKGLYYDLNNEQIPSLKFIPIDDIDIETINDVQTYIDKSYSYIDKLFEYPYKLFNIYHRNVYKGYKLDYSKEIADEIAKHSNEILNKDKEYKYNFKLNEINKIKKNKNQCNQIKKTYNKLFDDDITFTEENKDKYYTDIGLDFKQKQALLLSKERRCNNIHKVLGRINKNKNKNKILLQDLLINFNKSKQLLFGNQPFISKYSNNKKIIIDPFIEKNLELGILSYNKMINKAVVPCILNYSDLLFPCRVLINLNLNYNYFDNKSDAITKKELIYIGFFLVRLNDDGDVNIDMPDKCKKHYNFKDTYLPKSKERYYVLFVYKKNTWDKLTKPKRLLVYYNYFVVNYRCNFVNMGEITEYKRVLYTEIEQFICMNTQNSSYFYILLKIDKKSSIINIDHQCNHILEFNMSKKKNNNCIEANFHNSFIHLLNLNKISYYSDKTILSDDNTIYEQHLLISKYNFDLIYIKLIELLENQKKALLDKCKELIIHIRLLMDNNKYIFEFMNNNLDNHKLYYLLDNINNINDIYKYINNSTAEFISKIIKKINKYYNIYLDSNTDTSIKNLSLEKCKNFIINIRLLIHNNLNNNDKYIFKLLTNNLNNNDELYYILDNINNSKINKYYNIYLELNNINIKEEKLKINEHELLNKGYIKIDINIDESYALLPCHFDWSSNNIKLDNLSYEINNEKKKLYKQLNEETNIDKIKEINQKIKILYIKEKLSIKYGDMPQNKKDIYDACIEKECIDKIDKKRFTKFGSEMQIIPRVKQYFSENISEIFTDSNFIKL